MLKKTCNIIMDILLFIFIIFAVIMIMLSINAGKNGIASFLGFTPFSVQTNTMEPIIMSGDMIIVKQNINKEELKKDDIISFFVADGKDKIIQTGRIIEVRREQSGVSYLTQGDNVLSYDSKIVNLDDIIGIYTGTKIANFGTTYEYLNSRNGFFYCVIIPLLVFLGYQVVQFVLSMKEKKAIKKDEK